MERLSESCIRELERLCPGGIVKDVSLAAISQWRIGGLADLIIRPSSSEELSQLRAWFYARSLPHIVIGATSNLLFADEGLHVPCIQIGERMARMSLVEDTVRAEAGIWVPGLARQLMKVGRTGGEHICGIPGTLGGLICMNGGSQRNGIGSNVETVESVSITGELIQRQASECGFSYRCSTFQKNQEVVASATLSFSEGNRRYIREKMLGILADRRGKFPRKMPNCGSVFKSNPAMYDEIGPPGAVIERLGFKGQRVGRALVSPCHANFIVNVGGARAIDVLELVKNISESVYVKTGYRMEAEVRYVSRLGKIFPADKVV